MKRLRLAFLILAIPAARVLAQPDTIPVLLQPSPSWIGLSDRPIAYCGTDSIILTNDGRDAGIWFSTDGGRTFDHRDSLGGSMISFPSEEAEVFGYRYGPIWQIDSNGSPMESFNDGLTWRRTLKPQNPGKDSVIANGSAFAGILYWFSTSRHVILTRDLGNLSWDTLPFPAPAGTMSWYDEDHGARFAGFNSRGDSTYVARTHNAGKTWDTVLFPRQASGTLSYLAPNVLFVGPAPGPSTADYVSADTGHTWKVLDNYTSLQILKDSLWYAMASYNPFDGGYVKALIRSTDQGTSWQQVSSGCVNGPVNIVFRDSLHGLIVGTARTDNGGQSWDCLDTTVYAAGAPIIIPSSFDQSSYYSLGACYGTNYVCLSTDRGAAWAPLFQLPIVPVHRPWGTVIGKRLFMAAPDKVLWTSDFGQSFNTLHFGYPGASAGYISRTSDGTLWASNDLDLYVSRDTGNTWVNQSDNVPYRKDSFQLSYTFTPIDSVTGFLETSSRAIFRTGDAGASWQRVPDTTYIPTFVFDSRHWYDNGVVYTSDAGLSWHTIPKTPAYPDFLALDTLRWYDGGFYTTDAGADWSPIPGWDQLHYPTFTIVDSNTAFAGGIPSSLWRLDLPFYTKPKPMLNFTVDDQIWNNVPLQKDTGWVQMPVVIHNLSAQDINVTLDSVSDPIHFYLAPYQPVSVAVPKKASVISHDGLDSVWFIYQPTSTHPNGARAYWHSPALLNSDDSLAVRTDSLHGNPSTASVSEPGVTGPALSVSPNPATGRVTLSFSLPAPGTVSVTVLNVLGEVVRELPSPHPLPKGEGEIQVDLSKLPAGIYYARIVAGKNATATMVKVVKE